MLCILQVHQPAGVQTLRPEGSVEAFHERVFSRLACLELNTVAF